MLPWNTVLSRKSVKPGAAAQLPAGLAGAIRSAPYTHLNKCCIRFDFVMNGGILHVFWLCRNQLLKFQY
jgi:hypothetical protein